MIYLCLDCGLNLGRMKAYMRCNECYVQWYIKTGEQAWIV